MTAWASVTTRQQDRTVRHVWWAGYAAVIFTGLIIAAIARRRITEPYLGISLALVILLMVGWLIKPRVALYFVLFLTAVSDSVTLYWFPFVKNFSSRESIAYVADAATISPLEMSIGIGAVVSALRCYARSGRLTYPSGLSRAVTFFSAMVLFGMAYGFLQGAGLRIIMLEGRSVLYIALVFVIVTNECRNSRHERNALYSILAGVTVQALLSIDYYNGLEPAAREDLESLTQHGAATAQNLLIVVLFSALLFTRHRVLKWVLLVALVPTGFIYMLAQRRAGIGALGVGVVLVAISLFWRDRGRFWKVVPVFAIVVGVYTAAFWTSESTVGFPAQAVKTIVAPNEISEKDRSSDLYRLIENYNLNYTIRTRPLTGIGFGHQFYRPVPLPQINAFELSVYIPHNSLLWVWMKTGVVGFVALFYLVARALTLAAARIRASRDDIETITTIGAAAFVAMYIVFTFADISWDARNTALLGFALAVCGRSNTSDLPEADVASTTTPVQETTDLTSAANAAA
jgi:O-antigen ligase